MLRTRAKFGVAAAPSPFVTHVGQSHSLLTSIGACNSQCFACTNFVLQAKLFYHTITNLHCFMDGTRATPRGGSLGNLVGALTAGISCLCFKPVDRTSTSARASSSSNTSNIQSDVSIRFSKSGEGRPGVDLDFDGRDYSMVHTSTPLRGELQTSENDIDHILALRCDVVRQMVPSEEQTSATPSSAAPSSCEALPDQQSPIDGMSLQSDDPSLRPVLVEPSEFLASLRLLRTTGAISRALSYNQSGALTECESLTTKRSLSLTKRKKPPQGLPPQPLLDRRIISAPLPQTPPSPAESRARRAEWVQETPYRV